MYGKGENQMNDISIASIVLFLTSGLFFAIAILAFVKAFHSNKSSSEVNNERLILLNEVMLIHTSEKIEYQSPITDVKSE